jgi:hypothetical protein
MIARNWKEKAAAILDEAGKLWGKVSSRGPRSAAPGGTPSVASTSESVSELGIRIESLGGQVRQLEQDADASFDVVRAIAQQHSSLTQQHMELIQAVDETLAAMDGLAAKIRWLTWTCVALGVLALAGLVIAAAR